MMTEPSKINKTKNTVLTKILIIIGLLLLMLIPVAFIDGIIQERENYKQTAVDSISQAWSGNQLIKGPILTVPATVKKTTIDGKTYEAIDSINFSPKNLSISGEVIPEIRYKGIFKEPVYTSNLKISGNFSDLNNYAASIGIDPKKIQWNKASIAIGVTDLKGIGNTPLVKWNNKSKEFLPGVCGQKDLIKGICTPINVNPTQKSFFKIDFNLKGSDTLSFVPFAKDTNLDLSSSWINPSFIGEFLPIKKQINNSGFKAVWNISYLATNLPNAWVSKIENADNYWYGVQLLQPVDNYRNCIRSTKYAILFIAFTFLVCFLFEILGNLKIHPFQYILVGFAMAIFYLLLIAFSEFIDFLPAYLISSIATIALISTYTHFVLVKAQKTSFTLSMTAVLSLLYIYLYILLQLQDLSLLFGSIGIFISIAVVMFVTRNINWYSE